MNSRECDDECYNEQKEEKSEWQEWKQHDDARRYREYESDNRRPY